MSEELEPRAPTAQHVAAAGMAVAASTHCVRCEAPLRGPGRVLVDEATLEAYVFCGAACQAAWLEEDQ